MIALKRSLAAGLAIAAFAGTLTGFAAPAHADWYGDHDRRDYQEREYREHERRREEWRHRRYDGQYYYGDRAYVAPPIVYGPPPPPRGLNLLFNVR